METIYKGIAVGTEIVDRAGQQVGTVHAVVCNAADQLQLLIVQKGLIFKTDVAVPAAAIDRFADGKIHLNVERHTLVEMLKPTLEPPAVGSQSAHGPVLPQTAARAARRDAGVPLVQPGVVDRHPDQSGVRPDSLHDVDTATHTYDRGIGSAAVPDVATGVPTMVTGGQGAHRPADSQEPTSSDRT